MTLADDAPRPDRVEAVEVILDVGAEGGSLTIEGIRAAYGWRFRFVRNESALYDVTRKPIAGLRWARSRGPWRLMASTCRRRYACFGMIPGLAPTLVQFPQVQMPVTLCHLLNRRNKCGTYRARAWNPDFDPDHSLGNAAAVGSAMAIGHNNSCGPRCGHWPSPQQAGKRT
jgi:hypothetical protein